MLPKAPIKNMGAQGQPCLGDNPERERNGREVHPPRADPSSWDGFWGLWGAVWAIITGLGFRI